MIDDDSYHLVIVGGGIAGLYLGWYYQTVYPDRKTVIVEKNSYIGGRVATGKWEATNYEMGAGRISSNHPLLMSIIKHFDLELKEIDSYFSFVDIGTKLSFYEIMSIVLPIIAKLRIISMFLGKSTLIRYTIGDLAKRYLSLQEQRDFRLYFPYYSEVYVENAYEGFKGIDDFSFLNTFYIMQDGLESLISLIADSYRQLGGKVVTNKELIDYQMKRNGKMICFLQDNSRLVTNRLVVTGNINALKKIRSLDRLTKRLHQVGVHTEPLLRIYAVYPKNKNGDIWFEDLGRIVTSLPIHLIIPIDVESGLVMISYTDGVNAKWWKSYVDQFKTRPELIITEIQEQLQELFPELDIPHPIWFEPYYWESGGNFNKPNPYGFDYKDLNRIVRETLEDNIFVINNAFGPRKNWMEGSLQAVYQQLPLILK